MTTPQAGIFAQGTRSHYHLEFDVHPSVDRARLATALAKLREPSVTAGGANIVVGFGPDLWNQVAPSGAIPDGFHPFATVDGLDGHRAPATQHEIWVWVHGSTTDIVFEVGRAVVLALAGVAELALEQQCFVYRDSRDLTGFIDGSANPHTDEAAGVALVAPGEAGEHGSFAITARFVHDLASFHAMKVADQEKVFGRTKADSVEMDDDVKPRNAHIARVEIDGSDGEELEIFRRSVAFGTVTEQGIFFVGFSASLDRFDLMLERMYGLADDGIRDRLTDFTRAVSGSYWFVPSTDHLNQLVDGAT